MSEVSWRHVAGPTQAELAYRRESEHLSGMGPAFGTCNDRTATKDG